MKSLSLSQPHAIIPVGLPGSGKTFFATKFASTFGAPYVSYDTIRSVVPLDESIVDKIAQQQIIELLKTKHSLVIEGNTYSRTERTELTQLLRKHGYQALFVWVQTDNETTKARSIKAKKRTLEEHEKFVKRFSAPHASENHIVISGKHTYATQAKMILKRLSGPRADISTHSSPPVRTVIDVRRNK